MLSFNKVTKTFRLDEETRITPVDNVSLEIERGEFVIIVGRSGTGKTTLLNLAAGMVRPTSGQVTINNVDLGKMNQKQLSTMRSQNIGFIFQFPSLIPALTLMDNITLPSIFTEEQGIKKAEERASNLLGMLGLAGKMKVHPKQLSAGETKRAVIARALMNNPELVLADEPTSDLDMQTEKDVMDILRTINSQGVTFLIVTHSLQLTHFATRAFEMSNGNLNRLTAEQDVLHTNY